MKEIIICVPWSCVFNIIANNDVRIDTKQIKKCVLIIIGLDIIRFDMYIIGKIIDFLKHYMSENYQTVFGKK